MLKLDHILWGAPDLDAGVHDLAALTGVEAATGGTHPGFGTRNRLLSIGPDVFLEVIAPDPAQPVRSTGRAATIAALPRPGLLTFAVQSTDLESDCAAAKEAGLAVHERIPMTRTRPDGVTLSWTVVRFSHPAYGELIPFAIDWQGSPHPSETSPGGCTLQSLAALHPEPSGLAALYEALGLDIPVYAALQPGLLALLQTPKGTACLLPA